MEETEQRSAVPASSSTSSVRVASGAPPPSSSSLNVSDEDEVAESAVVRIQRPELSQPRSIVSYRVNVPTLDETSTLIRDDTWSCIIVLLTFWFFVSMTLILGVYGSARLQLGPNCSFLLQPNPIFVQYIKVEELDNPKQGANLFGLRKTPPLDVRITWSETLNASIPTNFHKEWIYFLNEGSQLNISYCVNSTSSDSVFLVIAKGSEDLARWIEDPSYPNTTYSWNIIHGCGDIQQDIFTSSAYYVAVGNLNSELMEVHLYLNAKSLVYNNTDAYYNCSLSNGSCTLKILFPFGNAALVTSPGPDQGTPGDDWSINISYGPRWITYIAGIGGLTLLMFLAFNCLNKLHTNHINGSRSQTVNLMSERTPLLTDKDDDMSSWGSSYDSASHDEETLEDKLATHFQGKLLEDTQSNNGHHQLCVICSNAPKDCFFLPCGHCAACFTCGTRIAEEAGACPICKRNVRKVRKIIKV